MDFLDMINPRDDFFFTGFYYERMPKTQDDGREVFNYRHINPYSRTFAMMMSAVQNDEQVTAIKTHDDLKWRTKGYVSTQNGQMWIIDQVIMDEQIPGYEQSARITKTPASTEYILRLVRVENPWGIGES